MLLALCWWRCPEFVEGLLPDKIQPKPTLCNVCWGSGLDGTGQILALGSSGNGEILNANFSPDGELNVNSNWNPENRNQNLGGRSFQVGSCLKLESHLKGMVFFCLNDEL